MKTHAAQTFEDVPPVVALYDGWREKPGKRRTLEPIQLPESVASGHFRGGRHERMWLRDLRATAKTRLRKAGVRTLVIMQFLGHAPTVHETYDNVDADDLRAAAHSLRVGRGRVSDRTQARDNTAVNP